MSFLSRLGLSLLLFGAFTLVAQFFGYAPRKLANFSPDQLRGAGITFVVVGGLFLALGGNPRLRRSLLIGFASLFGLAVLCAVAALIFRLFGRRHPTLSSPPPPPPSAWTPPAPGTPPGSASVARPGPAAAPQSQTDSSARVMAALYEKQRLWNSRHGRERTWAVVVHLGRQEAPTGLESSLQALAEDQANGGAIVARTGGLLHAAVAPLSRPEALRTTLAGLFPNAEIQIVEVSHRAVVFVR